MHFTLCTNKDAAGNGEPAALKDGGTTVRHRGRGTKARAAVEKKGGEEGAHEEVIVQAVFALQRLGIKGRRALGRNCRRLRQEVIDIRHHKEVQAVAGLHRHRLLLQHLPLHNCAMCPLRSGWRADTDTHATYLIRHTHTRMANRLPGGGAHLVRLDVIDIRNDKLSGVRLNRGRQRHPVVLACQRVGRVHLHYTTFESRTQARPHKQDHLVYLRRWEGSMEGAPCGRKWRRGVRHPGGSTELPARSRT